MVESCGVKQKFEILRETLTEFAQQDEFPLLLVGVRQAECPYVLKFVQDLEQSLPAHLVACFPQTFVNAGQWVDEIVAAVRVQLEYAEPERIGRREGPFPSIPLDIVDTRCAPAQRLHALLEYLPQLLPNTTDYRIVVGLIPLECRDARAFAELAATVIPHPAIPAWMAALRLIVWDDPERPILRTAVREWSARHVLAYSDDFSTPALTDALNKDAGNRSLPLDERMGAVAQLAALDFAYRRYADALDKYAVLHQHYFKAKQPEQQALALLGAGDTLHAAGDSRTAKLRLQQGLALAMDCKSLPLLVNLLRSAAKVSLALGDLHDAESYADSGTKVAAAAINPFAYCDFHALRGDAQLAQAKFADAMASYDKAREQCRTNEYFETWIAVLDTQIGVYGDAGMTQQQRALEQERDLARAQQRSGPRRSA